MSSMSLSRGAGREAAGRGAANAAAAIVAFEETNALEAFCGVLGLWLRGLSTMLPKEENSKWVQRRN
jgi:hypothetical protein